MTTENPEFEETTASRGTTSWRERRLATAVAAAACLGAALGALVLIGWYAGLPSLVRVSSGFVAMQYNTAVCVLLAATSLAALRADRLRLASVCAVVVLIVGGTTLAEHVTGWSSGLDGMLWRLGVSRATMGNLATLPQSSPGRMALTTSVSFTLLGGALLVLSSRSPARWRVNVVVTLTMVAVALGALAFSGFLTAPPKGYGWGRLTGMAVHTALAVMLLGAGTAGAAVLASRRFRNATRNWSPLFVAAGIAVATLMMWQAMIGQNDRAIAREVQLQAQVMANEITGRMEDRARLLTRLALRWGFGGAVERGSLTITGPQILRDYAGLVDLVFIDLAGVVRWSVPAGATARAGAPMWGDAVRASALTQSRALGRVVASAPVTIDTHGYGLMLATPVLVGDSVLGYLAAHLSMGALAEDVLRRDLTRDYGYVIRDEKVLLYAHRSAHGAADIHWNAAVTNGILGRRLTLEVTPTTATVTNGRSSVPLAYLVMGLLSSIGAAAVLVGAQRSRAQAGEFARIADQLAQENAARRATETERDAQAEQLLAQSLKMEVQHAALLQTATLLEERRDALERAQEFREALVRSTVDAVAALDPAGFVSAWNPAMHALTGRSVDDVRGRPIGTLLPFLGPGEEVRLLGDAMVDRPTQLTDVRTNNVATGDAIWLDVSVTPMHSADGRMVGGLIVARDVTERKRVADVIIASRNIAEEANRAKSDFLARMSHELRTPLNSVIGFTNVLRRKGHDFAPDHANFLDRIEANGRHLLGLINDVLDLSKIEAGRESAVLAPCDIVTIGRDTVSELAMRARESGVCVTFEAAPMAEGMTDAAKLKQVLINLIGNAIKFTPPEGSVAVHVIADAASGIPVRIEVRDTGIGIAPDRQLAIFEAFEQADQQTSRTYGGTGLGLAISRKLCELMRHELIMRSVPGEGSVFTVLLHPDLAQQAA